MTIRFTLPLTTTDSNDPGDVHTEGNRGDAECDLSSSDDSNDDQNWEDWVESEPRPCQSLFEDKTFPSVEEALAYDQSMYGFDLKETCTRLCLDFHQRVRLVNYIRKNKPSAAEIGSLNGTEPFFTSDDYLQQVLEDDPILLDQLSDWSDSDSDPEASNSVPHLKRRIRALGEKLANSKKDLADYRSLVSARLPTIVDAFHDQSTALSTSVPARDDDSHYFESYGEKDIHAVMIQDKVRTSSYAAFILTNPSIFRDAVVLDVGCGTGILSLFAARGGAKRVFAVDASDITERAEKIVKNNGMDDIITVIHGKVEDITLPDGVTHVDIIVSEWMGYALLYESMLDSVLVARDRFLRPGGLMAPSQCQLMLGLCDASEIIKERIEFWNDVYGFDLSIVANDVYDEAIVDVVGPNAMLSEPFTLKDLHLGTIALRQLKFTTPFTLRSTASRRTKLTAFVLYFDTFFTVSGQPVPPDTQVQVIKADDVTLSEVWPVGGKRPLHRRKSSQLSTTERITSFSTGPRSIPTHWKQTLFLLREPVLIEDGTLVTGTFHCRKSETNSRELEAEIHYSVRQGDDDTQADGDMTVQIYKIR